jgi:AmmeMemoRadiSam system protein A
MNLCSLPDSESIFTISQNVDTSRSLIHPPSMLRRSDLHDGREDTCTVELLHEPVDCAMSTDYRCVMAKEDRYKDVRPGSVNPRAHFWLRFVFGAVAVFLIWHFFIRPDDITLSASEQAQLLTLARRQLVATVAGEGRVDVFEADISDRTTRMESAFVSLYVDGDLRGCMIDQFEPHEPLFANVIGNLQLAAADVRFEPLREDEVQRTRIKVSIVHDLEPVRFAAPEELADTLSRRQQGVVLDVEGEVASYLPHVWETFPDPEEFLSQLCIKVGWSEDRWRVEPYPLVHTYRVYEFAEPE